MSPRFLKNRDTKGYRFGVVSFDCSERPHVHIFKGRNSAKFWIDRNGEAEVEFFSNEGFSLKQLRQIERMVKENLEQLRQEWDEFCSEYSG